jgi:hypothetical protein
MIKTTTYSDLLLYAYNETDMGQSVLIQRSLDGDPVLQNDYDEIVSTMSALDSAQPPVPTRAIETILQFC